MNVSGVCAFSRTFRIEAIAYQVCKLGLIQSKLLPFFPALRTIAVLALGLRLLQHVRL